MSSNDDETIDNYTRSRIWGGLENFTASTLSDKLPFELRFDKNLKEGQVIINYDPIPSKQDLFTFYVSRAKELEQAIKWRHIWDVIHDIYLDDETITHERFKLRISRIENKLQKATKRMYDYI